MAAIDVIRDGIPFDQITAKDGHKLLFGALVSTAMWAQSAGLSEIDWVSMLDQPTSELGRQNRVRRGRPETPRDARRRLSKAWTCAAAHRLERPDWSPDEARSAASATAKALRDYLAGTHELLPNDVIVLDYLVKLADDRGSDQVTLPRAQGMGATGLGLTAWRLAIQRLEKHGSVRLVERGARAGPTARQRKANVYKPIAPSTPKADLVVPPARVGGAPGLNGAGPDAPFSGAPSEEQLRNYLQTAEGAEVARRILSRQSYERLGDD